MSDARRVKKVRAIAKALEKLLKLAPVEYKFKDNDPEFIPDFVAQDFAKVFPQYVSKVRNNDNGSEPIPPAEEQGLGYKGWFITRLDVLIPWIVAALKELSEDLDQLKKRTNKRIKDVDDRFVALEARIASLEAAIPETQRKIVLVEDRVALLEKENEDLP